MKPKLLLACLAMSMSAAAQNTSPYWSLAGNSNAATSSKLGTTNAIPLRLFTNNQERLTIDASGRVGIGIPTPSGMLTIKGTGTTPAAAWVTAGTPLITGIAEGTPGNGDIVMAMASGDPGGRANLLYRRSRGTLAAPTVVAVNDRVGSFYASAYDGTAFRNAAALDFFVDAAPTSGNVPTGLSLATGTNPSTREERLRISSNGNVALNGTQFHLNRSTGRVGVGIADAFSRLTVINAPAAPAPTWRSNGTLFSGLSETAAGSADFILGMAASSAENRPVYIGRKSRGTLATPLAVQNGDRIFSFLASPFDGAGFQFPASIDFVVDGPPSISHVPTKIAFVTGSNGANRKERFSIKSSGELNFNNDQLAMSVVNQDYLISLNKGQLNMKATFNPESDPEYGDVELKANRLLLNSSPYLSQPAGGGGALWVYGYNKPGIVVEADGTGIIVNNPVYNGIEIFNAHNTGISIRSDNGTGLETYAGEFGLRARGLTGMTVSGTGESDGITRGIISYGGMEAVQAHGGNVDVLAVNWGRGTSGVYATNDSRGIGVRAISRGGYGLYGSSDESHGLFATTKSDTAYAGYFAGRVFSSGGYISASDKNLKNGIKDFKDGLSLVRKLAPKSYEFKHDGEYKLLNLPTGKHYGLIAQEVEAILPEIVTELSFDPRYTIKPDILDSAGKVIPQPRSNDPMEPFKYKAINYTELIPVLVKAIQEQQDQIEKQEQQLKSQAEENSNLLKRMEQLEARMNQLSGGPANPVSLTNASLGSVSPNPSRGVALVDVHVPANSKLAFLVITDMKGSTIRKVSIYNRGSSQVKLNTAALAAGTYTCSLLVDGAVAGSRQMMVAR